MDNIDQQLLSLLRKDARASVATLAQKLGVSRGTVTNRVTKLEDAGIIVGYSVMLRPDAQPGEISAWMSHCQPAGRTWGSHAARHQWPLGPAGRTARAESDGTVESAGAHPPDTRNQQHRDKHSP